MLNALRIGRVAAIIVVLPALGCASTHRVELASRFADAGISYADSVSPILDESFALAVTADSLVLAQDRSFLTEDERSKRLAASDELLVERLEILRDLKRHAQLLRSYFIALKAITETDAASNLTELTEDLATQMAALRPEITSASIAGAPVSDFVGPAITVATAVYQNAVLRRELEERGAAIERELDLQRAALTAIGEQMMSDKDLQIQIEERNPLVFAYVQGDPLPSNWSNDRIAAFRRTIAIGSLDAAAKAADNLHESWIAIAENRLGEGSLALLLRDVGELVRLTEMISIEQ